MNKIGVNKPCPCGSGIKFKKCHQGKIFSFKSENFTISAKNKGKVYKLFKISFHHTKNTDKTSIIVSFPYHKNSNGLLSLVTFPHNNIKVDKLSLIPGGKVTSHKIKYSHWKDGNVHFSQDGKIFTFKKEPSDILDKAIGHIFTAQFKGLKGFEEKMDQKKLTNKEIDFDIDLLNEDDDSIKFTGWWYEYSTVHPINNEFNTIYTFKEDNGVNNLCFALQPPSDFPISNMVLFLCVKKEFMTKERGTHVLFLGGFDKKEISKDIKNDMHFLAMSYPARNYDKLKLQVGSVDLLKP